MHNTGQEGDGRVVNFDEEKINQPGKSE